MVVSQLLNSDPAWRDRLRSRPCSNA